MSVKLKVSALATALLTLMSSTPAAMSAPTHSIPPYLIEASKIPIETDRNPNGAQVRVLFHLKNDEKLVCLNALVRIAVRNDRIPAPTDGRLLGDYNVGTKFTTRLRESTVKDTCVANFSFSEYDVGVGRIAEITIVNDPDIPSPGGSYTRDYGKRKQQSFIIKSAKQIFRIDGIIQPPQIPPN